MFITIIQVDFLRKKIIKKIYVNNSKKIEFKIKKKCHGE